MANNSWKDRKCTYYDVVTSTLTIFYMPTEDISVPDISELGAALMQYSEVANTVLVYISERHAMPNESELDYYTGHRERIADMKMIVSWLNQFTAVNIIKARIYVPVSDCLQTRLVAGLWGLTRWDRTKIEHVFTLENDEKCLLIKDIDEQPKHIWLHWIIENWFSVLEFHANLHVPNRDFAGTWDVSGSRGLSRGLRQECFAVCQRLEVYHCGAYPGGSVYPESRLSLLYKAAFDRTVAYLGSRTSELSDAEILYLDATWDSGDCKTYEVDKPKSDGTLPEINLSSGDTADV
ncbi:hypothetical protein ACMFMG_007148 [Clarireedia jacksonii]